MNFAESSNTNEESPTLLLAHEEASNQQDMWFFGSGASNHMCGRREYFIDLDEKGTRQCELERFIQATS